MALVDSIQNCESFIQGRVPRTTGTVPTLKGGPDTPSRFKRGPYVASQDPPRISSNPASDMTPTCS